MPGRERRDDVRRENPARPVEHTSAKHSTVIAVGPGFTVETTQQRP